MAIIKRETDYAIRALARLAEADDWMPAGALATDAEVPEDFLRKIMQRLCAAGLVESRQGPFGGYRLAASPDQVTVLDVLETIQDPLVMNECFADGGICTRTEFCPLRKRLVELQVELNARLADMTLAAVFGPLPRMEGSPK
ncbi:MAG: Rrf2 family transcriptional regulator [Candidatus Brocadiia bacterium]